MKKTLLLSMVVMLSIAGCKSEEPMPEAERTQAIQESPYYKDFSAEKFAELKGQQKFAVFFYADWCGTCKNWEKNIITNNELPANTMVLKADYDLNKDLVKKLNVKSQSSVVFFAKDGEQVDTLMDPKVSKVIEFFNDNSASKYSDKYTPISAEKLAELDGKQKFAIMFYADWCGTCRAWEKRTLAAINELPENTRILKANYDNDTELKTKYGITTQSTVALVNADGTLNKLAIDPKASVLTQFFQ